MTVCGGCGCAVFAAAAGGPQQAAEHVQVADVHDERVVRGPALGRVDALDGRAARGIRAEAVDCFCGECDGYVALL